MILSRHCRRDSDFCVKSLEEKRNRNMRQFLIHISDKMFEDNKNGKR